MGKTSRVRGFRNGLTKLISSLALATSLFTMPHIKAETPFQQGESTLEEKVKTENYVCLRKFGAHQKEPWEGPWPPKRYSYGHLGVDNTDNIYVIKSWFVEGGPGSGSVVEKFDKCGSSIKSWGNFSMPFGIAVDDNFVYVSEINWRILKFDLNGNFIKEWDIGANENGDLDIDSLGNVYINVSGNTLIKKFDPEGNLIKEWETGIKGDTKGWNDLAVDNSDNIYVPGCMSDNCVSDKVVRKFNSDGEFITDFDPTNENFTQFSPQAIAFDNQNNMYVCDTGNLCIQKFDSNGNFITRFSETDSERPNGVCVDSESLVYVSYSKPVAQIKKFVKLPVVGIEKENDTVTMSFESPPSFTHRVFRSSDLENWEQIDVLKSSDYQNWTDVNKFYSNGQKTLLRDPEVPTTQTFYKISVQEPDFRVVDGIEYCLETDELSYRCGEKVDLVYRVTNYREEPFQFEGQTVFTAEKDGESYFYTSAKVDSSTLAHGESKEIFPKSWTIKDDAEIGVYNVTGKFEGDYSVPITTTIDVVE